MARPIKETPFLHGSDARRFTEQINNPPKVSADDVRRAQSVYNAVSPRCGIKCCS
jgi:hypothetical protein